MKNPKTPELKASSTKGKLAGSNNASKFSNRKMSNDANVVNTTNSDYFSSFHNTTPNVRIS